MDTSGVSLIPAIGNGRPKQPSARELKGAVSRVLEVEWAKFTLAFFLRDRTVSNRWTGLLEWTTGMDFDLFFFFFFSQANFIH